MKKILFPFVALLLLFSCAGEKKAQDGVPVVGFLDAFEDETIKQAKTGFYDALAAGGFSEEKGTVKILYRNAQGDMATLGQACDFFITENVDLIATNTTIAAITAIQKDVGIPICMMVAPSTDLMQVNDKDGNPPAGVFGVYETLQYIDTSVAVITKAYPKATHLGIIYNQSEPQSVDAYYRISKQCEKSKLKLTALPVNNSSETLTVVQALIAGGIDAFFALPDNTVFASFESIAAECEKANIPVFTSEEGLVKRGAVTAFGADMYKWGYQAGEQAVQFLRAKSASGLKPMPVQVRKLSINKTEAAKFGIPDTLSID